MKPNQAATEYHSQIYEAFADRYTASEDFRKRFDIWTEILKTFQIAGKRVLDAGCGPGHLAFFCASLGCEVVAIDGAEKMAEHCRELKAAKGLHNLDVMCEHLPLGPSVDIGEFDVILSSSVIEYIDNPTAYLRDLDTRLKPGGLLVISVPNQASYYKKLESLFFRLTGRPGYLKYSKNTYRERDLIKQFEQCSYKIQQVCYYGSGKRLVSRLIAPMGEKRSQNIFVAVFKKDAMTTDSLNAT